MKRKRRLLILSGCIAAITLAFLVWPREREPEYDGVPLSIWLERCEFDGHGYRGTDISDGPKIENAIRHMGTNSLPFLLRWIQYEQPAWRKTLYQVARKLPHKILYNRTFLRALGLGDKSRRAEGATLAFETLGLDAKSAIPELKRLAAKDPLSQPSARATLSLMYVAQLSPGDFDAGRLR